MKNLFRLILILVCNLQFTFIPRAHAQNNIEKAFFPKPLKLSKTIKTIELKGDDGQIIDLGMACSLTQINKNHILICNYANIFLLNLENGNIRMLSRPAEVNAWYPTGLKYCSKNKTLYVANYLGKDILTFKFDKDYNLLFNSRYVDPELVGPENISVTKDGKYFAVADFDGDKVHYFNGQKKLWSFPVSRAHGVSLSKDEKYIYASGLSPVGIYRFSLKGELLNKKGVPEWGKNGYLWPTSVLTSLNKIAISDAHTGKICFINEELETQKCLGGNGPGDKFFNMPYGAQEVDGNTLIVTDTFKSRILVINIENEEIEKIYSSPSLNNLEAGSSLSVDEEMYPLGKVYRERTNKKNLFKFEFPFLRGTKEDFLGAYGGFVSKDGRSTFYLNGSMPLFSSALYYFTFGAQYSHKGKILTIIGSPQCGSWLINYQGIILPVHLGTDFWLNGKHLLSTNKGAIKLSELIEQSIPKINEFITSIKSSKDPLDAISSFLSVDRKEFDKNFESLFQTSAGKELYAQLKNAKTSKDAYDCAKSFLTKIEKDNRPKYIIEISIAHMLMYSIDKIESIPL